MAIAPTNPTLMMATTSYFSAPILQPILPLQMGVEHNSDCLSMAYWLPSDCSLHTWNGVKVLPRLLVPTQLTLSSLISFLSLLWLLCSSPLFLKHTFLSQDLCCYCYPDLELSFATYTLGSLSCVIRSQLKHLINEDFPVYSIQDGALSCL